MTRRLLTLLLGLLVGCSTQAQTPDETTPDVPRIAESPPSAPPSPAPSPKDKEGRPPGSIAAVTRVIDGDTIEVKEGLDVLKVRLIGIDTPETVHPSQPVECLGKAASEFTRRRLEGKDIRLEFDVERLDPYGRTLAYVWRGRTLFNELIVAKGFAQVSTYPPNVKYVERFLQAQREARRDDRGLWGACPVDGEEVGGGSSGGQGAGESCDSSYPDVCIPPPPPDLDCAEVSYRQFRVTGSDPHGFDGDGDGVGCES